jgi:hypothetical protein
LEVRPNRHRVSGPLTCHVSADLRRSMANRRHHRWPRRYTWRASVTSCAGTKPDLWQAKKIEIGSALASLLARRLGAVPACAKRYVASGHATDDPSDLMYAGALGWTPLLLDAGRDDYWSHGISGCLDLAQSPYFA